MSALIRAVTAGALALQAGLALAAAPIQDMSANPRAPAAPAAAPAAPAQTAPAPLTLDQRVDKLERAMDSQSVLRLLNRVEALQQEVQRLRGDLDVATHEVEALKTRQRELYMDLDQRLKESKAAAPAAPLEAAAPAPVAPPAAGAPVSSGDETQRYQQAFNLFKEGKYDQAIEGFRAYLNANRQGAYADNAQYWLGEAYYSTQRYKEALQEFNKVVSNHPTSQKMPDATLKIGLSYYELADWPRARKQLEQVVANHPNTTIAKLAQARLDIMKTQGH